jgi:hypothetical protein
MSCASGQWPRCCRTEKVRRLIRSPLRFEKLFFRQARKPERPGHSLPKIGIKAPHFVIAISLMHGHSGLELQQDGDLCACVVDSVQVGQRED